MSRDICVPLVAKGLKEPRNNYQARLRAANSDSRRKFPPQKGRTRSSPASLLPFLLLSFAVDRLHRLAGRSA